ncbi:S-formylglutathione hydrolase isoform X2 [Coccinella septempunctata]|nr:S-formylglutathione hydrolase isoform X2 [Coccinella septempunctata]
MSLVEVSRCKSFEGTQVVFSHESKTLGCIMKFGIYLPPQHEENKLPVIYWLSGLTCSESNFIEKAGAQRYASEHGVVIVNPDTSPRGLNISGDKDSWDFGEGAGFYVDATQEPWKKNYNMYSYVTKELRDIINSNFNVLYDKQSIMGHSMGGHGALICALKNPGLYKSVSAFSPICNPSKCPWGIKAFSGYLGPQETSGWADWDATELSREYKGPILPILIEQGSSDKFLKDGQLLPENLVKNCENKNISIRFNNREGYDHSYFFISSFIGEHIKYHMSYIQS